MSEVNVTNTGTKGSSSTRPTTDENKVKILSKEEHIAQNLTATGRKVVIEKVGLGTSFLKLAYGDGKPGALPNRWAGVYTGPQQAENARHEFILETWMVAEDNNHTRRRA